MNLNLLKSEAELIKKDLNDFIERIVQLLKREEICQKD